LSRPTISIVTPSFNQAEFIERTIDSVLGQGYPGLEYIVVDGASTDGTVEILARFGDRIRWTSEKDSGQSEAINKGLRAATGDIVAFLNSDDEYLPGALFRVAEFFEHNPTTMWAYGKCRIVDADGDEIRRPITWYKNLLLRRYSYRKLLSENFISQPATFWRREIHDELGYFDEDDHWCMDYEFWLRVGSKHPAGVIDSYLANFRYHMASKSAKEDKVKFQEELRIAKRYAGGARAPLYLHRLNYFKIVGVYQALALLRRARGA